MIASAFVVSCEQKQHENPNDVNPKTEVVYTNKLVYNVNIGDTIKIYNSTNSCCPHCAPNRDKLKHIQYLDSRVVVDKPYCDGCNVTTSMIFIAKSKGSDTILQANISPHQECIDTLKVLDKYIVNIK